MFSWVTLAVASVAELPPVPDTLQHAVVNVHHDVKSWDDYRWLGTVQRSGDKAAS